MALGHVRYSTTGSSAWENAQPVYRSDAPRAGARAQRQPHERRRAARRAARARRRVPLDLRLGDHRRAALHPSGRADRGRRRRRAAAPAGRLLDRRHDAREASSPSATRTACARSRSAMIGDRYCVASESCALDIIGAKFLREVEPGEVLTIDAGGISTRMAVEGERRAFCVFEYIYFARPDSIMDGTVLQGARGRMGEILAREAPVEADLVIAVPDSGNPAARGYARASGIPQDDGFVKNRYVARTFIQPGPGAAQARPATEVQPDAGDRQRAAARRRRRLDRARQHDAPDRADAARRGRAARCTCASPRRRSGTPATTASTCPRARRWSRTGATVDEIARELGADSLALPLARRRLRGGRRHARDALRRLLHGRVPAAGRSGRAGQARLRAGAAGHTRVTLAQRAAATPRERCDPGRSRRYGRRSPWTPARRCTDTSASTTSAPARRRRSRPRWRTATRSS